MRRLRVVSQRPAVVRAQGNKAGMLATAVVVALVVLQALGRCFVQQGVQARHMAAAAQHAVIQIGLGQNRLGHLHMHGLAVVAGAQQGQLRRAEPQRLRRARLQQGQGLQDFERRAGKAAPMRIARMGQHCATVIHHSQGAKVQAFAVPAARQFYQGHEFSRRHCVFLFYRTIRPKPRRQGACVHKHTRACTHHHD